MAGKESKTEKPTQKRLQDAWKKGDIARSRDLATSLSLGGALLYFVISVPWMSEKLIGFWRNRFGSLHQMDITVNNLTGTFYDSFRVFLLVFTPLFIVLALIVILTNMIEGKGLNFRLKNIHFDFSKLNFFKGLKRLMLSVHSVMEVIKSIIKISVIALIAYRVVKTEYVQIISLSEASLATSLQTMARVFLKLSAAIILFLLVLSILDFLWQKHQYLKKMKMTKQEIKDEYKQMEGDPKIKGKRRQIQYQRAMSRMMEKVPHADVVITNPTHYAVALSYEFKKVRAPVLVAKGKNLIALRIIEKARQHHVPIIENPPLARGIFGFIELNHMITDEYFHPVAEILAYIYRLKGRRIS